MSPRFAYWIAVLFFAALVAAKFDPTTGFTGLVRFGESWELRRHPALANLPIATVPRSSGYDGQFYAQLAIDPFLRHPATPKALDAPTYRARRILIPALAHALGWGDPSRIITSYALINVFGWLVLAWLVRKIVGEDSWQAFAVWVGCMFGMGVLESVRQSLVDLPALLFSLVAIVQFTHAANSTLWLALGNLAKESNVLAMLAINWGPHPATGLSRRCVFSTILATLPLLLWTWYVSQHIPDREVSGLGNLTWPLLGFAQHLTICGREILAGNLDGRYVLGLVAAFSLLVQTWSLWRNRDTSSPLWRLGAAYSGLLLFLGPWVWGGYWAACRALLPLTIVFNLRLLRSDRRFWLWWGIGNFPILHAVWRFI